MLVILLLFALYVGRVVYVSDFVLIHTHFKYSLFAISTIEYTWTLISEVYTMNNWYLLYKMLATLTTIATTRYIEWVTISGMSGACWDLCLLLVLRLRFRLIYMLLLFIRFAITHAATFQLRGCQILRFNILSTCIEALWFRLHRIRIRLYCIVM